MKVVRLQSENVMRLKAVDITPDPNSHVIQLTGKNAQGKSSILNSIEFAMRGKDALKGVPRPIHDGQKKAEVILDLGEYIVNRRWTSNDRTYLEIVTKENASIKSPQALLDKLYSDLSFDPLEYLDMAPKKQLEVLMSMVKLDIDPVVVDGQIKKQYDDRTEANREVKRLEGVIAILPECPVGMKIPDEEVDMRDILAQKKKEEILKAENDDIRDWYEKTKQAFADKKIEINNLHLEIANLQEKLIAAEARKNELASEGLALEADVLVLQDPDLTKFDTMILEVENINKAVRLKKQRSQASQDLAIKQTEVRDFTARISDLEETKREAMKRAKFPVPGLSFDEAGVLYNGLPLTQASSAQQLMVSLAMAASANPELRVIHIKNGSLLDSESRRVVEDYANLNDLQVWVEVVKDEGGVGLYIEDGSVKSIDGIPCEKKA